MLRKNSTAAFAGRWVFPGGHVDPSDRIGCNGESLSREAAARRAAAREAREEAFVDVDPQKMTMISYWIAPDMAPKRYATWFFAALAKDRENSLDDFDPASEIVTIDNNEIAEGQWMNPAVCLQRHEDGEFTLLAPTWVTLHLLRNHQSSQEALRFFASRTPRYHASRFKLTSKGPIVMWAGDGGYEANDVTLGGRRHRLEMFNDGYRFLDFRALANGGSSAP